MGIHELRSEFPIAKRAQSDSKIYGHDKPLRGVHDRNNLNPFRGLTIGRTGVEWALCMFNFGCMLHGTRGFCADRPKCSAKDRRQA
jgi:hypothetical protein